MRANAVLSVLAVAFLVLGGCSACEPQRLPGAQPGGDASNGSASADDASPSGERPPPVERASAPRQALSCRAIAVDGDVRTDGDGDGGEALGLQTEITSRGWISLGPGARLVSKDPRTARETTFRGPALVRTCVDSGEESWVAAGVFDSSVGAGESPGAEEWIVTPLGVVRFAAAKLAVQVSSHRPARASSSPTTTSKTSAGRESVRIAMGEGVAFLWAASDATERALDGGAAAVLDHEGWIRIAEGTTLVTAGAARAPLDAAGSALDSCVAIGKSARDLASALLEGDGAAGSTAALQVATRRLARAACAVAALRVDTVPEASAPIAAAKESLAASLHDAISLWRALPPPP